MKKFLTVLLALSVIFTYSFSAIGTAFAAGPDDPAAGEQVYTEADVMKKINDTYNLALKDLAAQKEAALKTVFGAEKEVLVTGTGAAKSIEVTKTAVESVYNDALYDAAVKAVTEKRDAAISEMNVEIDKVKANAASNPNAKPYTGYFTKENPYTNDWKNEGYAEYKVAWETKSAYLTASDVETGGKYHADKYTGLFSQTGYQASGPTAGTASGTNEVDVAKAVFKEVRKPALAAIQAIDLSGYSKEYLGSTKKSNYDLALADVTTAINAINALAPDTWDAAADAIKGINDIYTAPVNQGNAKGYLYEGNTDPFYTGLNKIPTIADEPTEEQKLVWAKAKVLDTILGALNTELKATKDALNNTILEETMKGSKGNQKKIADSKEKLATAEEEAAAATETIKYLVENTTDYTKLVKANNPGDKFTAYIADTTYWDYTDIDSDDNMLNDTIKALIDPNGTPNTHTYRMIDGEFVKISKHVVDLKEQAEILKKAENIDGATIVAIEEALADAIDETYRGNTKATIDTSTALSIVYKRQVKLIGDTGKDVDVNGKKYPAVEAWTDNLARDYDGKYFADVRKAVSETEEAITAATSVADADAAFIAGYEKFQAVPTKKDKETVQATKEFQTLLKDYTNDINKYIDYKEALIDAKDYSWTPVTMKAKLVEKFKKAYTIDELKAALADAKGEVDNLKTKAALKAAADALTKRMNELPKVTVADRELVGTLIDDVNAHNKYCDMIGDVVNKVILKASVTTAAQSIKDAEAKAVKDQYAAINKDKKVMTNEAEAVKALRTAYDAFVAYYSDPEEATIVEPAGVTGTDVTEVEKALDRAFVKEFVEMVAQLPADGSDVAGIVAARAAYDALSDYAKYDAAYGVGAYQGNFYDKLVDLEKLVIRHVQGMKLTASSTAKKGSITIKWKVKGDSAAADGFQVYRSKKMNSGYGTKAFYKTKDNTKRSYKNTKSLKKGTKYYYKVRAYKVVDGKTYYSDWSNKAYRTAK